MTPHDFFDRWAQQIRSDERDQFMLELAFLLTSERSQERRQLCTDRGLYREACAQIAAEPGTHGTKMTA